MIEFCKATEDRDTCLLRRGHIEDHEYGDLDQLVALAWQAGVNRVFTFLDRFNLMDKDELAKFGKAFPFLGLPEEQKPLTPEQQAWAQSVVNRLKTAPAEVDEAARQRAQAATATHRCKVCGALWKLHPADPQYPPGHPLSSKTWSCVAPGPRRNWGSPCGKCCDMAPMGDQIEALSSSTVGLPSAAAPQVLVEMKLEKPKYTLAQVRGMEFLPAGWTRADSERLLPLPEGWRWLKDGERILVGDVCHDPRGEPVEVVMGGTTVTNHHHPIRRITTRAVLDPLQWALCKHDILKRDCKECPHAPELAPTTQEPWGESTSSNKTPPKSDLGGLRAQVLLTLSRLEHEVSRLRVATSSSSAEEPCHCIERGEQDQDCSMHGEVAMLRDQLAESEKQREYLARTNENLANEYREALGWLPLADREDQEKPGWGKRQYEKSMAFLKALQDRAAAAEARAEEAVKEREKVRAKLKSLWRVVKCSGGPRVPEQYNVVRDIEPSERGGKQYEHHGDGGFTLEEATQKVAVLNAPIIGEDSR